MDSPHLGHLTLSSTVSSSSKTNFTPVALPDSSLLSASLASNLVPFFDLNPDIVDVIPSFNNSLTWDSLSLTPAI